MGWLLVLPKVIAYDKQKHGALGVFTGLVIMVLSLEIGFSLFLSSVFAVVGSFIVGYLIELKQKKMKNRHYDMKDALFVMYGSFIPVIIINILIMIKSFT